MDAETGLERAMKLLISDLDGTLYPRKESLNPHQREENFKAIKRWVDRGHQFAVAQHGDCIIIRQFGKRWASTFISSAATAPPSGW